LSTKDIEIWIVGCTFDHCVLLLPQNVTLCPLPCVDKKEVASSINIILAVNITSVPCE